MRCNEIYYHVTINNVLLCFSWHGQSHYINKMIKGQLYSTLLLCIIPLTATMMAQIVVGNYIEKQRI